MDEQSLMREWTSGPFRLELHDASRSHFGGPTPIGYQLYHDGQLIFEGDDIAVPAGQSLDGDQTVRAVLNFLTQRPGDVEPDYFACYTPPSSSGVTSTRRISSSCCSSGRRSSALDWPLRPARPSMPPDNGLRPHAQGATMPRPRRLFFADIETPLSLTTYGYAALPDHDMALQQHTDQGMVFRVEADTAQQAAEQVIGLIGKDAMIGALYDAEQVIAGSQPIAWVAGQLDPRLLPPLLQSDLPLDLPDDPPSDHDGGGGGWGQGWDEDPGGGWSWT